MRIGPSIPEDRDINLTWPRQESRRVSDGSGGWLQDCLVKVGQGGWIFLLVLIGAVGAVLTGLALPHEAWWLIITGGYFMAVLGVPAYIVGVVVRKQDWTGIIGSAIAFVLLAGAVVKGFDVFIWDPLDVWTRGFFDFSLPVVSGWTLLMGVGAAILVGGLLVKKPWMTLGGGAVMLGSLGAWLWTCEFERPGLMFYLLVAALDGAYVFAAASTVKILRHEQVDVYEPYSSESPPLDEPEPVVVQEHHNFVRARGWPRGDTEEAPQPRTLMATIDSRRPRDGKNGELVRTKLRIDEFCEALGHAAVMGLRRREMLFTFRCTGRKIAQWNQWYELVEPLVQANIYDRETGTIHPDFDHEGYIDPWQVLEALSLTQYERMIP